LTFIGAAAVVGLWIVSGPLFGYSDTWQLVINTGTTIITFLMVFLIQNTQNRDTAAMQIKLDELIRVSRAAHNALLDLEELDEEQLDRIRRTYGRLAEKARGGEQSGKENADPVTESIDKRMLDALVLRRAIRTQEAYIDAVARLARHYRRSPTPSRPRKCSTTCCCTCCASTGSRAPARQPIRLRLPLPLRHRAGPGRRSPRSDCGWA
jgi:low affinity Fe/Cu permease